MTQTHWPSELQQVQFPDPGVACLLERLSHVENCLLAAHHLSSADDAETLDLGGIESRGGAEAARLARCSQ